MGTPGDQGSALGISRRCRSWDVAVRFVGNVGRPWCWASRQNARVADWIDEQRAHRRRTMFGRWRARLSSPESPRTIERTARTRAGAIARAARAIDRVLALRSAQARDRQRAFRPREGAERPPTV